MPTFATLPQDGRKRWFTSDLHLGHDRCAGWRGFGTGPLDENGQPTTTPTDLAKYNAKLINNFNSVIGPDDIVIALGDMVMGHREVNLPMLGQLLGEWYLVPGNHDHNHPEHHKHAMWEPEYAKYMKPLPLQCQTIVGGQVVNLCHFPYGDLDHTKEPRYLEWRPKDDGNWLLHGHVHGRFGAVHHGREIDLGVDNWNLFPVPEETIIGLIS